MALASRQGCGRVENEPIQCSTVHEPLLEILSFRQIPGGGTEAGHMIADSARRVSVLPVHTCAGMD